MKPTIHMHIHIHIAIATPGVSPGLAFADASDLWCQASQFRATGGGKRTAGASQNVPGFWLEKVGNMWKMREHDGSDGFC